MFDHFASQGSLLLKRCMCDVADLVKEKKVKETGNILVGVFEANLSAEGKCIVNDGN